MLGREPGEHADLWMVFGTIGKHHKAHIGDGWHGSTDANGYVSTEGVPTGC